MRRVNMLSLFNGLLIILLVLMPYYVYVEGADLEPEYDRYVMFTIYPSGNIIMTSKGSYSDMVSSWDEASAFKDLRLIISITTAEEDNIVVENDLQIIFNPSDYLNLTNLNLDLIGHSSDTKTNMTAQIDYPGYFDVNGNMGFVIVEPPYEFVLDLEFETKLYYSYFPMEELQMLAAMIPLLKTQLASQIMAMSDGSILLQKFELVSFEEAADHALLNMRLSISGDLYDGLWPTLEEMGAELTPSEEVEESNPLRIEVFDYHITFVGDSLSLEADSEGTIAGDFNGELNTLKDSCLKQLLERDEISPDAKKLITLATPIDLHVQNLLIDSSSSFNGDMWISKYSVAGLELESTFVALLEFLEELSRIASLEDFKLVLDGGVSSNQYVVFSVPTSTKKPIVEEEQRVVWDMVDIENLQGVTYAVKTKQLDTITLFMASTVGLLALGAVGYFLIKR